ncbi:MAG: hypothetical protein ACRCZF_01180 [Gemmataceae bacterium]
MLAMLLVSLAMIDDPKPVAIAKLSATPPADWKSEKPATRLRSHQFKFPSGIPDVADAELIVLPESSPKPEKEFPRWRTQFQPPEGKTVEELGKESKLELAGGTVHLLDVSATWKYKERPFDPKSKEELKPEWRVIWAIVVTKEEAVHLRLSGPQAVVGKRYAEFEGFLKALK